MADPIHVTRALRVLFYSDSSVTVQDDWFRDAASRPYTTHRYTTTAEQVTSIGARLLSMPHHERPQAATTTPASRPAAR